MTRLRRTSGLVGLALATLWLPGSAAAADFYDDLYESGRRALVDGDLETAVADLEVACFGMLESPPKLAVCRSLLAVAFDRDDNGGGFREQFRLITDLERRFGAFSATPQDTSLARAFRQAAERRLEPDLTERLWPPQPTPEMDADAGIVEPESNEVEVPYSKRRKDLRRQVRLDPGNSELLFEFMLLEAKAGYNKSAIKSATQLLLHEDRPAEQYCAALDILVSGNKCESVSRLWPRCTMPADNARAAATLECILGEDPAAGQAYAAAVPKGMLPQSTDSAPAENVDGE